MGICESPIRGLELERGVLEGGYECIWLELELDMPKCDMMEEDEERREGGCGWGSCGAEGSLPCASSSAILRCSSLPLLLCP